MATTPITPSPSIYSPSGTSSSAPSYTSAPLRRTSSRESVMSTRSVSMSTKIKLDPNRPKFKVKPRPKEVVVGGPTESVANFQRDEYLFQRPLYVAAYMAGYFVGSPDLAMNVVKAAEKGVTKVTGLSSDPIGDRRERKRKAALAKLSAMDTYGVTPEPTAAVERVEGETKQDAPKA